MFESRLRVVYSLALLWFAVLGAKLFSMQIVDAEYWRDKSRSLSQSTLRLAARRGEILDRNGEVLASDRLEQDLMVRLDYLDGSAWVCRACGRPAMSGDDEAPPRCRECRGREFDPGPRQDLSGLPARIGRTPEKLAADLEGVRRAWRVHVDREIRRLIDEGARVRQKRVEEQYGAWQWALVKNVPAAVVKEVSLRPARYRGLSIRSVWRRARIGGPYVADIVGRVGNVEASETKGLRDRGFSFSEIYRMRVGRSGIEKHLEDRLASRGGHRLVDRDPRGGAHRVLDEVPAQDGETVRTSIDLRLQKHMGDLLAGEGPRLGARGAFFTAIDPATGEVLVYVGWTRPEKGINLAFSPTVPGSVFKVVTAMAGVGSGEIDPDVIFDCTGRWHGIGCHGHTHGPVDLSGALSCSCNGYFGNAADVLGIDLLSRWARRLGFGAATGLEITGEASGLVPDREWKARRFEVDQRRSEEDENFKRIFTVPNWHRGETWQIGFGQGALLVTPIQVARLMALVANGGHRVEPTFVVGGSGDGERVLDAQALAAVRKGLEAVVDEGTAAETDLRQFLAAGKTGTGDLPKGMRNVAWFAGYAPREAPRVAFACCFVDVKGYGGGVAGPVCVEFLRELAKE